jgi:hypothetical protein
MTQQETQDRNKEIAKLLGWEQYKDSKERWFEHWKPNTMLEKPWSNRVERLEFDSDWNWLIESALKVYSLISQPDSLKHDIIQEIGRGHREAAFIKISDFAKKFNNKEL